MQDRQKNVTDETVVTFESIPRVLPQGHELHGDIVVDVNKDYVTTIGGNLGNSVKQRGYPRNSDGYLAVAKDHLYTREGDTPGLSTPKPPTQEKRDKLNKVKTLNPSSRHRIFAALSIVDEKIPTTPESK
jgi:hypothetical protein